MKKTLRTLLLAVVSFGTVVQAAASLAEDAQPDVYKQMAGEWVVDTEKSVVNNSRNSGAIKGGAFKMKVDGRFDIVVNYSDEDKSEGAGKIVVEDGRIDVVYDNESGEWQDDIAELAKDGKTLTITEEFNADNWKLVFVRKKAD